MANANEPGGFRPLRHLAGGLIRSNAYKIQSGYASNIFTGDAVALSSQYLNVGGTSGSLLGIFAGCKYIASDGSVKFSPYWPASTATSGSADVTAYVYDDPNITYRVQASVDLAYVDASHKNGSFDLVGTNAGSTLTGQSGQELNLNDTGTGQFLVLGLLDTEVNNAAGLNAKLEVKLRKSVLAVN